MMKIKLILPLIVCAILVMGCSNDTLNDGFSEIKGFVTYEEHKPEAFILNKIVDGKNKEIAMTKVGDDDSFGFAFKVEEEGFYQLTTPGQWGWNIELYLKPNDNINLEIDANTVSYKLLGDDISKESIALNKWDNVISRIRFGSRYFWKEIDTYKTLFPKLENLHNEYIKTIPEFKVGNSKFDRLLELKIHTDIEYNAMMVIFAPRTEHATKEEYIELYNNIKYKERFLNDDILELPHGVDIMIMYTNFKSFMSGKKQKDNWKILSTDRLKGEYFIKVNGSKIKDYTSYQLFENMYGKYITTPSLRANLDEICAKVTNVDPGAIAPDFTYPDTKGNMVSLSDFKGKVVVIDVWATWCAPCIEQVPFLIKLEKELHKEKDLIFLSISVDKNKDKQKWLNMIKDKNMGGVHIITDGFGKVTNDYKIEGIPRFMIINKDGTIYNSNAPRPSDPAMKDMLIKLLGIVN